MLIKMNLSDAQVLKLEELKQLCGENTGSKAALFSLENFCALQDQFMEMERERNELQEELQEMVYHLRKKAEADKYFSDVLQNGFMP